MKLKMRHICFNRKILIGSWSPSDGIDWNNKKDEEFKGSSGLAFILVECLHALGTRIATDNT